MSAAAQNHVVVELVGGPLDGQRFVEVGLPTFSHNPHHVYSFGGSMYRPVEVAAGGVLKMKYAGVDVERRAPADYVNRVTGLRTVD